MVAIVIHQDSNKSNSEANTRLVMQFGLKVGGVSGSGLSVIQG